MIRSENLRQVLTGLGIVGIQTVLLRHLEIYGAEADLVLIYLLWICTKRQKTDTLLFAATLGFLLDAFTDLWGLHMFSKVLTVFILHGYLTRISKTRFIFWQVFILVLFATFLHNVIFYGVSIFAGLFTSGPIVWSLLLVSPLFTSIVGSFLHLVREES